MYPSLREKWLMALSDPDLGPGHSLMVLQGKSPWGYRLPLQPRALSLAANAGAVTLIGPAATGTGERRLVIPDGEVCVLHQLDYFYEAGGAAGDPHADVDGATLKFLVGGEQDRRLPEFRLDHFARGTRGLRFGRVLLHWVIPPEKQVELVLTPTAATADESMDVWIDLQVRHEPRWLMEAAGLVDPAGREPGFDPHRVATAGGR